MFDVLVVGAGPAGLSIAAALSSTGLNVLGITPADPATPWTNTYGTWCDDLAQIGLDHLLGHRWSNCVVYTDGREFPLGRDYGLFDNRRLQEHLPESIHPGQADLATANAATIEHCPTYSRVTRGRGHLFRRTGGRRQRPLSDPGATPGPTPDCLPGCLRDFGHIHRTAGTARTNGAHGLSDGPSAARRTFWTRHLSLCHGHGERPPFRRGDFVGGDPRCTAPIPGTPPSLAPGSYGHRESEQLTTSSAVSFR